MLAVRLAFLSLSFTATESQATASAKEPLHTSTATQDRDFQLSFWLFPAEMTGPCQVSAENPAVSVYVDRFGLGVAVFRKGKTHTFPLEASEEWNFVFISASGRHITACLDQQCGRRPSSSSISISTTAKFPACSRKIVQNAENSYIEEPQTLGKELVLNSGNVPVEGVLQLGQSEQLQIDFSNNLSLDYYLPTGENVVFGTVPGRSYPDLLDMDPVPTKERGIHSASVSRVSQVFLVGLGNPFQVGKGLTIAMWIAPKNLGDMFTVHERIGGNGERMLGLFISNWKVDGELALWIKQKDNLPFSCSSSLNVLLTDPPVWVLAGLSLTFEVSQTKGFFFTNSYYDSFVTDQPIYTPATDPLIMPMISVESLFYRMYVFKNGKTMFDISLLISHCGNSLCPIGVTQPIPTCSVKEYVDSTGRCQPCLSKCQYGCVRPTDCTLCDDPLCYRCSTFGAGTCSTCVARASVIMGLCTCDSGTFQFQGECLENCPIGSSFDGTTCIPCGRGCISCEAGRCRSCDSRYLLVNGECSCGSGYYISANGNCEQCQLSCAECSNSSDHCTKCWVSLGYVLLAHECRDCSTFTGYIGGLGVDSQPAHLSDTDALNAVCKELCGDGLTMGQLECDDGNLIDGDGCSSLCTIESGWECTIPTPGGRSVCVDIKPPTAFLVYLHAREQTYQLNFTFSEEVKIARSLDEISKIAIKNVDLLDFSFIQNFNSSYTLKVTVYESVPSKSQLTLSIPNPSEIIDKRSNPISPSEFSAELPDGITIDISTAVSAAATSIGASTAIVASTSALTSMFAGTPLHLLWSFIEALQMINYLVYISAVLPENLRTFLRALNFANFEFIPSFFSENDEFKGPPQPFARESVHTGFLANCGNMVTILIIILGLYGLALGLAALLPAVEVLQTVKAKFVYSIFLRTGIESFLQVWLGICLQFYRPYPGSVADIFSLFAAVTAVVLVGIFIGAILKEVLLKSVEMLKETGHKRKFDSLYGEFSKKSRLTRSFLLIQLSRKALHVSLLVFLSDNSLEQCISLAVLTALFTFSILVIRPFKVSMGTTLKEVVCEAAFTAALCVVSVLTADLSISTRSVLGWVVIALLLSIIILHFVFLAVCQFRALRRLFAQWNSYFASKRTDRTEGLLDSNRFWFRKSEKVQPTSKDLELEVVATQPADQTFQPDDSNQEVDSYRPQFRK